MRDQLWRDQGGLCAYCEIDLREDDATVEHFVPASATTPDEDWDLRWDNLLLVCSGGKKPDLADDTERYRPPPADIACCGAAKGRLDTRETPILSPYEIPPFPRLFRVRSRDGEIAPDAALCLQAGIETLFLEETIQLLGLNCPRLKDARLAVIAFLAEELSLPSANREIELAEEWLSDPGEWPRFFTTWRFVLGDAAEQQLGGTGFIA